MKLKIVQSCDKDPFQNRILGYTGPVNKKYCQKFGYKYEQYIGNKVEGVGGVWNKIIIPYEELQKQECEWLLILDPDAFIYDHYSDLYVDILHPNISYPIVGQGYPHTPKPQTDENFRGIVVLNGGSVFYNLSHELTPIILEKYKEKFFEEKKMPNWQNGNPVLGIFEEGYLSYAIHKTYLETGKVTTKQLESGINFNGSYIKHVLNPPLFEYCFGLMPSERENYIIHQTKEIMEKYYETVSVQ